VGASCFAPFSTLAAFSTFAAFSGAGGEDPHAASISSATTLTSPVSA